MVKKLGRPNGSKTNKDGVTKLHAATREELKTLYAKGMTTREIGETFGASRTAVDNRFIALGVARRWHTETGKWKNAKMSIGLSKLQEQLLLGSCLGDACLFRQTYALAGGGERYAHKVCFAHGEAQLPYLEHKHAVLRQGREHLSKLCVSKISQRPLGSNLGRQMSQFSFSHTPTVLELEKRFQMRRTSDAKVWVSQEWVDGLEAPALAYWFLDDGCLLTKERDNATRLTLFTNAYDSDELMLLLAVVAKFGAPSARLNQAREGQFIINVNRPLEIAALVRVMRPHIPDCMQHKLKDPP